MTVPAGPRKRGGHGGISRLFRPVGSLILAACAALAVTPPARAAEREIRSCYDAIPLDGVATPQVERELFVLIDQTVVLDRALRDQALRKIGKFLAPGDRLVVVSFSAYLADRYTRVLLDAQLDRPLDEQQAYDVPKRQLQDLEQCRRRQAQMMRLAASQSITDAFEEASGDLPRTELIGNLARLTEDVMKSTRGGQPYVLIISDMLEHSETTTFYGHGRLRDIDPEAELRKVSDLGMIGDFRGARVYVLGAGYSLKGTYRAAKEMQRIEAFWRQYLERSNGTLAEFGSPSLLGDIGS